MKFFEILLSFLASQGKDLFQQNTEALSQQIVNNSRRVVILLAVCVISIALLCSGISMGYASAVANLEKNGEWIWTAGVVGGLLLAGVSLGGLFYSLGEDRWMKAVGRETEQSNSRTREDHGPGLDSAFAVLITEIALQLKESRKNASKTSGETP